MSPMFSSGGLGRRRNTTAFLSLGGGGGQGGGDGQIEERAERRGNGRNKKRTQEKRREERREARRQEDQRITRKDRPKGGKQREAVNTEEERAVEEGRE